MKTDTLAQPTKSLPKRGTKLERITRKLAALDAEDQKRIAKRAELLEQLAVEKRTEANMSGRAEFIRAVEQLDATKREAVIAMVLEDLVGDPRRDKSKFGRQILRRMFPAPKRKYKTRRFNRMPQLVRQ